MSNNSNNDGRRLLAGTIAVCVSVALVASYLLLWPLYTSQTDSRDATDVISATNGRLQQQVESLQQAEDRITERRQKLDGLRDRIPERTDVNAFYTRLTTIAANSGVTVKNVSFGNPQPADEQPPVETGDKNSTTTQTRPATPAVYSVGATVTTGGSLQDQRHFIDALQNPESRAAVVHSITLAARAGQKNAGEYTMTVTLNVFSAAATSEGN